MTDWAKKFDSLDKMPEGSEKTALAKILKMGLSVDEHGKEISLIEMAACIHNKFILLPYSPEKEDLIARIKKLIVVLKQQSDTDAENMVLSLMELAELQKKAYEKKGEG